MIIKFLKPWSSYDPGVIGDVPDGLADRLIADGIAMRQAISPPAVETAVPPAVEAAVAPSPAKAESVMPLVKRKRGRPRKNPLPMEAGV